MKQKGDIKSDHDDTDIICINCYGDMTLDKYSSIIPKDDNIMNTKLQIFARNIYLRSDICGE